MKVLHINCNYIGTRLHSEMVEHLKDFGIKSTVYVPVSKTEKADITIYGSHVIVSKCFQKWQRFFFDCKQGQIVRDIQKKTDCGKYDCIHAYTLFTDGNCARRIGRKYKVPYVVAVRDTDVNTFLKKAVHLRHRAVKILQDAAAIFFLSETYREQVFEHYVPERLRQEFYAKSHVIPNGVDDFWLQNCYWEKLKEMPKHLTEKQLNVLCVGVVSQRKNQLATQQALQLLREQGWTVHFQIIGKVLNQKLLEKVLSYPDTEYISQQPKEKLLEYYRQNDIFVMPSVMETFGLTYAEAMGQGLPVIYTRGQGFDGQFEEGRVGYAVDAHNPKEIADRIQEAVSRYEELSENCLQLAGKFNWKDICERYREIYQKIIAEKE